MSKELKAFKDALLVRNVVARVVDADDEHLSKTFPSQEALNDYMSKHPNADKSKHKVEDADTTKLKNDLHKFKKDEDARAKAKERKDKKEDDAHAEKLKKELGDWKRHMEVK